jgi:hypothetical protein
MMLPVLAYFLVVVACLGITLYGHRTFSRNVDEFYYFMKVRAGIAV